MPTDQVGTPTYNRDLADATKRLVEAGASGVVNVGGAERSAASRLRSRWLLNELRGGGGGGAVANGHAKRQKAANGKAAAAAAAAALDAGLLSSVTTSNAGQAAKRPLASGLTLDKVYGLIPVEAADGPGGARRLDRPPARQAARGVATARAARRRPREVAGTVSSFSCVCRYAAARPDARAERGTGAGTRMQRQDRGAGAGESWRECRVRVPECGAVRAADA